MASVWMVIGKGQDGRKTDTRSWGACVDTLQLNRNARSDERPHFGAWVHVWPTDVAVHVEADEAAGNEIPPGWYVSPLTPGQARSVLGECLGRNDVTGDPDDGLSDVPATWDFWSGSHR